MRSPQNTTVLIVEDDEDLRDVIAFDFIRKGFKTITASNGREAFDLVKSENVDIVISDVRMPGGDGVEFLERVRAQNLELPIVMFITGFTELTPEEAYHKGANALFTKPFDRDLLMNAVYRSLMEKEEKWKNKSTLDGSKFKVELQFLSSKHAIEGKNLKLGRGGISIYLDATLPNIDDEISFKISFSDDSTSPIEGLGIVRWIHQDTEQGLAPCCGIEFIGIQDNVRTELIQIIESMNLKSYIPAR